MDSSYNKVQINYQIKVDSEDEVLEKSTLINIRTDSPEEAILLFNTVRLKLNGAPNLNNPVYEVVPETHPSFLEGEDAKQQSCPFCHSKLVRRQGQRGAFYGCSGYPKCRYTRQL